MDAPLVHQLSRQWHSWAAMCGTCLLYTSCPRIKISDNVAKISTPCFKKPWRLFDRETGKAIACLLYTSVLAGILRDESRKRVLAVA